MPLLALLLLFAADDPATAPPVPPPPEAAAAPAPTASPEDPNRLFCVKEQQAGTLFTRKVCRTKAEWKKLEEKRRRNAEGMLDTGDSNISKRD